MENFNIYWLAPTGERFTTIPGTWHNISPFDEKQARLHGWERRYERLPDSDQRTSCTKYELVRCLEEYFPEFLTTLKAAYAESAELQFYWNTVIQLDRDNSDFQSAVSQLGITEAQLDDIFKKITDIQ